MSSVFKATITNSNLIGICVASILLISLGFLFVKKRIFNKTWIPAFSKLVLEVSLPAIAFRGFMSSMTIELLKQQAWIILISFVMHGVLCFLAWIWSKFQHKIPAFIKNANSNSVLGTLSAKTDGDIPQQRVMVMFMLLVFGMTTTFGLPVLAEFYKGTPHQSNAIISASIYNFPQRIFLYTYGFIVLTGMKSSKQNFKKNMKVMLTNPTLLITFFGFVLWLLQLIPSLGAHEVMLNKPINIATQNGEIVVEKYANYGLWFQRIYIDQNNERYIYNFAQNLYTKTNLAPSGYMNFSTTIPFVFNVANMIAAICTPIVWFSVGMKMGESKLKHVFSDKWAWIYTIIKIIVMPAIILGILKALNNSGHIDKITGLSIVVIFSTPPGAVPTSLSLSHNQAPHFTARASALSTLASIIFIPTWIVISEVTFT
ncbi:hypothetical protein E1I18_01160 [Mycoplasmopsis mucosicanis]|uniref:Malate permease n=1 Tax=Mycoplasmopsis mucosicanis TaxID=458208 RepID=A0A507SS17_9BACT|nr:AEC family transporter [Mycoplasmopsis mucosicanis]TQC54051.1 hypothetical protein E1I18_01160 [Mycoplasmopsis mucosicanis]